MCLAIFKPAGLDITKSNLKNAFDSNNDGCGLCWAEDGQLHVEKGMLTFDKFYEAYEAHKNMPMLIHFRKSTHGKKDAENCHPFLFNDNQLALIHNGVLPIKCSEDGYSDTWHFVNKVLEPMVKDHGVPIYDASLSWFIRVSIGSDKVVVMDTKGEAIIFNEDKGNWEDADNIIADGEKGKVWYSNYSFRYGSNRTTGHTPCNHTPAYSQSHLQGNSRHAVGQEDDENPAAEWEGYGYHQSAAAAANKPLEIATDADRGPGKMTEYGWFDSEIEAEIESAKTRMKVDRGDAILHVFNNA